MGVPKKQHSARRQRLRRTHDSLKKRTVMSCPKCGEPKLPHKICDSCGTYKGSQILEASA